MMEQQTEVAHAFEKRNKSFRQGLQHALKSGLESLDMEEFAQSFPDCTEEQAFILYDLNRQVLHQIYVNSEAEFEDYCAEGQLWDKLSALEELEEQQKLQAGDSKPGRAPREAALGYRVLAKRQEVEDLEAALSKAKEEENAAGAKLKNRQAQVTRALGQYKPLENDLKEVHVACKQWVGREATLTSL